jgi:hypothetical protein
MFEFNKNKRGRYDNLLTNCLLQKLYIGCAFVYDPAVDFYTHWVNAHIVCKE